VVEITSKATRARDKRDKFSIYAGLGVQEYFQYDPTGQYLQPALRGYRLNKQGHYQELSGCWLEAGILSLSSATLGLELHLIGERLRLFNPRSGTYLRSYDESEEQLEATAEQLETERRARQQTAEQLEATAEQLEATAERLQQTEAEIAALRTELERLRSGTADA
jgi:vacuolar-type H+-ATPase subunit I/STV1